MAITWRGSTVTPKIDGNPPLNGNVATFAIVNTFRSRVLVNVLRLVNQLDVVENPTGTTSNRIMPIIRARRCAASDVSGGFEIKARPAWDTSINTPDPGVKLLFDPGQFGAPDSTIVANNRGGPFWQQFTARQTTAIEQFLTFDNFCVPAMAASKDVVIRPGEALIIEQVAALPTGGVSFFNIAWEEDTIDAGYDVAGNVQLSGSPVSGAKVILVTDSSPSLPNPKVEVLTTGVPGTFIKKLASGVKAAVFVQHENGGTKYTDEGKPYIEKV